MGLRRTIWLVLAALVALSIANTALAANGPYYGYAGYGYGAWWYGFPLKTVVNSTLPYYSVFPPVYYSYPVARPYGYSPYAYPPGTPTPSKHVSAPVKVRNVYAAGGKQSEAGPKRIKNPFVGSSGFSAADPSPLEPRLAAPPSASGSLTSPQFP
jgi:hypothetical protein